MNETLLQFIWQFQYFDKHEMQTKDGQPIEILFAGNKNIHQGPDFLEAQIRINKILLVGSVEVHIVANDWEKHKHSSDVNYKNTILHVVYDGNAEIQNIPTFSLKGRISKSLLSCYDGFMQAQTFIPCEGLIGKVPEILVTTLKDRLVIERLERKVSYIQSLLSATNNNWEECFWHLLARAFGMKVNAEEFEFIAKSIPVKVLAKHKTNLLQLEALLMGQANLLSANATDAYEKDLYKEYLFLREKYSLKNPHVSVKFLRMRPDNFPTIRLSQLAVLISQSTHLLSKMLDIEKIDELKILLAVEASVYWQSHYNFGKQSTQQKKKLGTTLLNGIIINAIAPILFAYGQNQAQQKIKDKSIKWLSLIEPENNVIIGRFAKLGIKVEHASDSQALLELKSNYCDKRFCLKCAIGNYLLKHS